MDTPQRIPLPETPKPSSPLTARKSPLPSSLRKASRAGPSNSGVSQLEVFATQPSSPSARFSAAEGVKTIMKGYKRGRSATSDASAPQPPNGGLARPNPMADTSSLYSDSVSFNDESPGAGPSTYNDDDGASTIGKKRAAGWLTLRGRRLKGSPTTSIRSLLSSPNQSMVDSVETVRPQARTRSIDRAQSLMSSSTGEGHSLAQPADIIMTDPPLDSNEVFVPLARALDGSSTSPPPLGAVLHSTSELPLDTSQSAKPATSSVPPVSSLKSNWLANIQRGGGPPARHNEVALISTSLPAEPPLKNLAPTGEANGTEGDEVGPVAKPNLQDFTLPHRDGSVVADEAMSMPEASLDDIVLSPEVPVVTAAWPIGTTPSLPAATSTPSLTTPAVSSSRGWFVSSIIPWGDTRSNVRSKMEETETRDVTADVSTTTNGVANTLPSSIPSPSIVHPGLPLDRHRTVSVTKKHSVESIETSPQELDSPPPTSTLAPNPTSTRFTLAATFPSWKSLPKDTDKIAGSGVSATKAVSLPAGLPGPAATLDPEATNPAIAGLSPTGTSASQQEDPVAASPYSRVVNPIRSDHGLESGVAEAHLESNPAPTATETSWWNYIAGLGGGPTAFPPPVRVVQTPAADYADRKLAGVNMEASSAASSSEDRADADAMTDGLVTSNSGDTFRHLTTGDKTSIIEVSIPESTPVSAVAAAAPNQAQSLASATSTAGWVDSIWSLTYRSTGARTAPPGAILETAIQVANPEIKTEAEMVKEEALRNEASNSVPPATTTGTTIELSSPTATSPVESPMSVGEAPSPNPVSMATPTRTWMSLFSSKNNLAMRRVSDGRDIPEEQHMEVMDIPDDIGSSVSSSPASMSASTPPEQPASDTQITIRPTTPTSTTPSESSIAQNNGVDDKEKLQGPVPPLTNSNTVKRKVSTNIRPPTPTKAGSSKASSRTGSPAPSKKNGSGTKEKKEKQNFVLPTFGDTFYTLPRILPPPGLEKPAETPPATVPSSSRPPNTARRPSTGITKKTFKLVSSLLGGVAPPKHEPKEPESVAPKPLTVEKEPSEDMVKYLEERKERVARTWLGKSSVVSSSASSTHSSSPTSSFPVAEPGSTLTLATGSGSAKSVRASSLLGVAMDTVPMGRIAHKGHHHISSGAGQLTGHAAAVAAAKTVGKDLPRIWDTLGGDRGQLGTLAATKRVVVIGIHGWFPGAMIRTMLGEPTGTSAKLASMMSFAVEEYVLKHDVPVEKVTMIHLEGEGTIARRVAKLYQDLLDHPQWVSDVHLADVILVATHSQGSVVSTQLLAALIADGHIRTEDNREQVMKVAGTLGSKIPLHPTKVLCLALCGIHLGPLLYLNTSSLVTPYINYFETAAARELFEFQDTASEVSQKYVKALGVALDNGVKFVYIASLDDQVVPIYSGTFMTASHPLILRSLYIDGDAYNASDFLSNLIVLLLRIRNAGLDDGGLITHLSEGTAGSLSGVGHSNPYLNQECYELAVRFMFETSGIVGNEKPELRVDHFQARATRNDYEIPWALRGVITDPAVLSLFASEIAELRQAFDDWAPKTAILRDLRRKLEPIQSLRILPPSPLTITSEETSEAAEATHSIVRSSKL
ncbi:hypothetical protein FRB94_000909 [Tulasnella sp. JGI-2019a]|nr:hypothetical protein FRB94_000909 [Tulasnella sp. JGI-2019a]